MKNPNETIKLLNRIQENAESTQRESMKKIDISLRKVNFLIKALTDKGLIKFKRFKNFRNKRTYL